MPRALQKCRQNYKVTGKGNSGKTATVVSHARSMEQGTTTCPKAATYHTRVVAGPIRRTPVAKQEVHLGGLTLGGPPR